jgi:hypothetical protein
LVSLTSFNPVRYLDSLVLALRSVMYLLVLIDTPSLDMMHALTSNAALGDAHRAQLSRAHMHRTLTIVQIYTGRCTTSTVPQGRVAIYNLSFTPSYQQSLTQEHSLDTKEPPFSEPVSKSKLQLIARPSLHHEHHIDPIQPASIKPAIFNPSAK